MSSPYTRLYTEDEEIAYDSGRMDMKHEILQVIRALRAASANQELWDRARVLDLAIDMICAPYAEDELAKMED